MNRPDDFQKPADQSKHLTDNIISQSLDFNDWLVQIQPEENRPKLKQELDKSNRSQSYPLPLWMIRVIKWFRQLLGLVRKRQFIEFLNIKQLAHYSPDLFWGGHCDSPQTNTTFQGSVLLVRGWVIGRHCRVTAVRLAINQTVLEEIPVVASRPDVNKAYPFLPKESFGYSQMVSLKTLPDQGTLKLNAVLEDGQVETIALIEFYRY